MSIWDRLLGTYIHDGKKPQPEIVIGVPDVRRPEEVTLAKLILMPFKRPGPGPEQI